MAEELYIYNSVKRKKEIFKPQHPPFVGMYVCGPTVYNEVHLGNLRTFISFDIVFRFLSFLGYKVRYVRNITDVGHLVNDADEGEDKITKQARIEELEPMEVVQQYSNSFRNLTAQFNLWNPSIEPSATGHIVEQIDMIKKIISNGYAYEVNGSVYFDVKKYHNDHYYGVLSGRKIEDLISGSRALDGQKEKKGGLDFALWKKASAEHIMKWDSPWGEGFPGWHLECSVMSTKYLGITFDIHGGGMDLKFPHHECEIAQNIGAEGVAPVKYWMHTNMLTVNGVKMSKSKGNSFWPHQLISGDHPLLDKGYSPMAIRFFILQSHYSSELDFSNEALKASEKGYQRLIQAFELVKSMNPGNIQMNLTNDVSTKTDKEIIDLSRKCISEMKDDFNTPKAIATLFNLVSIVHKVANKEVSISVCSLTAMKDTFQSFIIDILGLDIAQKSEHKQTTEGLMKLILDLRGKARSQKDWATSDMIRNTLEDLNIILKDDKEGSSWVLNN